MFSRLFSVVSVFIVLMLSLPVQACEDGTRGSEPCDPDAAIEAATAQSGKGVVSARQAAAAATPAEATTVKSSKSNSSERVTAPPPVPVETSNLNLSKSNVDRISEPHNEDVPDYEDSDEDG